MFQGFLCNRSYVVAEILECITIWWLLRDIDSHWFNLKCENGLAC